MELTKNNLIDLSSADRHPLNDKTIGQLVADISRETSGLVQAEINLAKAELKKDAVSAGVGVGMFGGAALFALSGFTFLWVTVGFLLMEVAGLSGWISFGIVTLFLLVVAGILALVGKSQVTKVKGPQQTIDTTKQSIETIKTAAKR